MGACQACPMAFVPSGRNAESKQAATRLTRTAVRRTIQQVRPLVTQVTGQGVAGATATDSSRFRSIDDEEGHRAKSDV